MLRHKVRNVNIENYNFCQDFCKLLLSHVSEPYFNYSGIYSVRECFRKGNFSKYNWHISPWPTVIEISKENEVIETIQD